MKINELKELQANGIKMEEVIQSIKTIVKEYISKCDIFSIRYSAKLTDIALQDVQNYLQNSGLQYSVPSNNRFHINGTDIEFIVADQGFTIGRKGKDYKSFLVELIEESKQTGYVFKHIKYKGNLLYLGNDYTLNEEIKKIDNIEDLNEIYQGIKSAINDVMHAENQLKVELTKYEYYEYKNESNRYKTIDEIVEKEL